MVRKSVFALLAVIVCAWVLQASPSAALTIGGVVRQPLNLSTEDLARFESATVRLNELTRDNQFRGVFTYHGVSLRGRCLSLPSCRKRNQASANPSTLPLLSGTGRGRERRSPGEDGSGAGYGHRSHGELFLSPGGERIMIAGGIKDRPFEEGKFTLIFPDDASDDRTAKALSRIEVVSLKGKPKFYIIGMGCADTRLGSVIAAAEKENERRPGMIYIGPCLK